MSETVPEIPGPAVLSVLQDSEGYQNVEATRCLTLKLVKYILSINAVLLLSKNASLMRVHPKLECFLSKNTSP